MPNYSGIWTEQAVMQANGAGNWPNAPGAPTIGTASATGATTASVAFTAPTFLGLPAVITSYTVTSSPGGLTGTGASSPITVSGLTEGTPYTFTVTATNASGTSPASAASNSVTPIQLNYVEEVFSTTLYAGNASTQTITNNINLSTNGGLVWIKRRDTVASGNYLATTVGGTSNYLQSNSINPYETSVTTRITSFNTDGFSLGAAGSVNGSGAGYVSWTFREQPKFFDIVTWSGNDVSNRQIAHNLGSVPGCIIARATGTSNDWAVYHRSLGNTKGMYLNLTQAQETNTTWGNTTPTSSVFTTNLNGAGNDYIAYLFAHDAGGFGATGSENVISCGGYTGDGSTDGSYLVSLGYEPQWVLVKRTDSSTNGGWHMIDTMRGMPTATSSASITALLLANSTAAEVLDSTGGPKATGFSPVASLTNTNGATYIYIAIRRGPMKVPTDATTVFEPNTTSNGTLQSTVPVKDAVLNFALATPGWQMVDRLRGIVNGFPTNTSGAVTTNPFLVTNTTAAESTTNCRIGGLGIARSIAQAGTWYNGDTAVIANGNSDTAYFFQRAPSFFDVVCYTGTGSATTQTHNLGVVPELMIVKRRSSAEDWLTYSSATGNTKYLYINGTATAQVDSRMWNDTTPTSSVFTVGTYGGVNSSGGTFVAYLFATCAGVSKVGSYTGTGATQTINCGFISGARWVMIKRTDGVASWYVWDTARGMVSGTDPSLQVNFTSGNVSGDSVFTVSTGFQIVASPAVDVNSNGGSYIFLAIA